MSNDKRISFLGCSLDNLDADESIKFIDSRISRGIFTQHVVVNVAKLINMRKDKELYESVNNCDLINVDGMGVLWGANLLGHRIKERVAGIDLFTDLLKLSENKNYPIFLLGSKKNIIERTTQIISDGYPHLNIAGYHHGYFWEEEEKIVEKIKRSGAKLLFVAITSPKKENFINKWTSELGVDFVMGVGGTFDVISGEVTRAPKIMQKIGLEWFYRLLQEPRRMWKRYLYSNTIFFFLILKEYLKKIFKYNN